MSIKNLETDRKVSRVITQNVDSLHYKAGSENVTELHGTAFRVICLDCEARFDRHFLQEKIHKENPLISDTSDMIRPDGDVEIPQVNNLCNDKIR